MTSPLFEQICSDPKPGPARSLGAHERLVALYPCLRAGLTTGHQLFQFRVECRPPHGLARPCFATANPLVALVQSGQHVTSEHRRNQDPVVVEQQPLADCDVAPCAPEAA